MTGLVFMIGAIVVAAKRKKKPVAKWAHTKRKKLKHSEQGPHEEESEGQPREPKE